MKTRIDHSSRIGEKHGVYEIIGICEKRTNDGHVKYICKCSNCGRIIETRYSHLTGSSVLKECNHIRDGMVIGSMEKHMWKHRRLRAIHSDMLDRCYRKLDKSYRFYGQKGIEVCDDWIKYPRLFEEWATNNGYKEDLTLDRIKSDLGYSPDNCRWVTMGENAKYKSTTSMIDVDGEVHTGRDWASILGIGTNQINTYIRKYGLDDTTEFIRRFRSEERKDRHGKSYFETYMTNANTLA